MKKVKSNKFVTWVKQLSPYTKNKFIISMMYLVMIFITLGINYMFIFGAFVPKFFILDIALMLLSLTPIFFFKKNIIFEVIWLPIIFLFVALLATLNVNYYQFFGVIFSIKDLKIAIENMGQGVQRIKQLNWVNISVNIILFAVFLSALLTFDIKFKFKENKVSKLPRRRYTNIFAATSMLLSLCFYEFNMAVWTQCEKNDGVNSIDYVNFSTNYHFNNLGLLNYYNKEIRQMLFTKDLDDNAVINYFSNPTQVIDRYSGLLKDKNPNVMCIMLETGDYSMINEATTPNLYNFFKEKGICSDHYYSFNHTNVANHLSFVGNYASSDLNRHIKYSVPFALPQILKSNNYSTRFYHDTLVRNDSYKDSAFYCDFGFDNFLYHDEIIPEEKPWEWLENYFIPDSIFATGIVKDLKKFHTENPDKPFYSQWMSMFMHMDNEWNDANRTRMEQLYATYGPALNKAKEEGKWVNPCSDDAAKQKFEIWTLKTMDFDKALGTIIDYLYGSQADDYLKNTILVVFGDHAWYETCGNHTMASHAKHIYDPQNINLYKCAFGIYHPDLETKMIGDDSGLIINHELQKMITPACITPTLLDLMGISYNKKIYQDQSIFDLNGSDKYDESNHELFYSIWLNLYMDEHYTSSNGGYITKIINDNDTKDLFNQKVKDKEYQLRIINSIYHNNFFSRHNYKDFLPK